MRRGSAFRGRWEGDRAVGEEEEEEVAMMVGGRSLCCLSSRFKVGGRGYVDVRAR